MLGANKESVPTICQYIVNMKLVYMDRFLTEADYSEKTRCRILPYD